MFLAMWESLWYLKNFFYWFMIFTFMMFLFSSGALFKLIILLGVTLSMVWVLATHMSSWWSLILFLVYISGVLILFSYFTAFSSKDGMKFYTKFSFLISVLLTFTNELEISGSSVMKEWVLGDPILYVIMGSILFLILVMTCMMCYKSKAPLRPFMKF
uniref:NADH dehydrogenase subunit 6 n=1 Tax=Tubulipora flabellaris TaxID=365325 RepID=F6GPJ2_9BILA|nr:NADH dehydrogenase subunit 6 [Tubulipora flabellaris]ACB12463.1 NADH dehydrogenase subunit 6 [Tubulipora flabellaris]